MMCILEGLLRFDKMIREGWGWFASQDASGSPPPIRSQSRRQKKARNKEAGEIRRYETKVSRRGMLAKCSWCHQPGHNKRACKLPTPQPETKPVATQTQ